MNRFRQRAAAGVWEAVQLTHENMRELMVLTSGTYWSLPPMRAITGMQFDDHAAAFDDWIIRAEFDDGSFRFYPVPAVLFDVLFEPLDDDNDHHL